MEWLLGTQDHIFEVKLRNTDCGEWIQRRACQENPKVWSPRRMGL